MQEKPCFLLKQGKIAFYFLIFTCLSTQVRALFALNKIRPYSTNNAINGMVKSTRPLSSSRKASFNTSVNPITLKTERMIRQINHVKIVALPNTSAACKVTRRRLLQSLLLFLNFFIFLPIERINTHSIPVKKQARAPFLKLLICINTDEKTSVENRSHLLKKTNQQTRLLTVNNKDNKYK